jgi:hypothetical protein
MAQEKLERIRPRRKAPIIAELKRRDALYKEMAVERWLGSFPAVHRGFDLDSIKEDKWGGRLTPSDVFQVLKYVKSGGSRFMLLQGPEGVAAAHDTHGTTQSGHWRLISTARSMLSISSFT